MVGDIIRRGFTEGTRTALWLSGKIPVIPVKISNVKIYSKPLGRAAEEAGDHLQAPAREIAPGVKRRTARGRAIH